MKKQNRNLRRRPLFAPLLMPLLAGFAAILLIAWAWNASNTTTVLLVRHAEKMPEPVDNPSLSPAGAYRAKALAGWLADSGLAAIYVSEFDRTRETAEPVAERTGAPIVVIPAGDVAKLAGTIRREHRGGTVLVVGHSDTLPAMIETLGGAPVAIGENEYSRLYVVTDSPLTRTTVLALRFGG